MEIGHTRQAMKMEIAKRGFFPFSFPQLAWSADTPHLLTHEPWECPSRENHAVIATLYCACAIPSQLTYTFFHLSSTLQVRLRHYASTCYKAGCAKAAQPIEADTISYFSPTFRTALGHFESTRTAGGGSGGLRALFKRKQSYLQRKSRPSIPSEGLLPHPSPRCSTSVIPSVP